MCHSKFEFNSSLVLCIPKAPGCVIQSSVFFFVFVGEGGVEGLKPQISLPPFMYSMDFGTCQ